LQHGALVMMDALGFKGIWNRPGIDPESVLHKLVRLSTRVPQLLPPTFLADSSVHLRFLSDTIVIGVPTASENVPQSAGALLASAVASHTASLAVQEQPGLAFRGCLSLGKFSVRHNFIVGPAVDEAAELASRPDGAFVVFTPGARDGFAAAFPDSARANLSDATYPVPMKGGATFRTMVVTPWAGARNAEQRRAIAQAILATFVGNLDVDIKRANTKDFLEHGLKEAEARDAGSAAR
jgi:hypothetical protein